MGRSRRCSGKLYETLEVSPNATKQEIKKAYHKAALQHHPDKAGPSHAEQFKTVQQAHAILMDDEQRKLYDSFGHEGMKKYADVPGGSVVALNPALIILYPVVSLTSVVCIIAFLALLVRRVDDKLILGTWASSVFVPLWILSAVLCLIGGRILLLLPKALKRQDSDDDNPWRRCQAATAIILTNVIIALLVAATAEVSRVLDGNAFWGQAFTPIFCLVAFIVLGTLVSMNYQSFLRSYAFEEGVEVSDVDPAEVRLPYIGHVAASVINIVCIIMFSALLYHNLSVPHEEGLSYWVVFIPVFIRIGLPVVAATIAIIFAKTAGCGQKFCATVAIIVVAGLAVVTVVLLALKCENAREGKDDDYPALGTVLIPAFIVLSGSALGSLFMLCAALNYVRDLANDSDEDVDEDRQPMHPRADGTPATPATPPQPPQEEGGLSSSPRSPTSGYQSLDP